MATTNSYLNICNKQKNSNLQISDFNIFKFKMFVLEQIN